MTDMTPGPVVEAATPGSGGAGVRESGEGSKTPVPPLNEFGETVAQAWRRYHRLLDAGFPWDTAYRLYSAGYDINCYMPLPLSALTGVQG